MTDQQRPMNIAMVGEKAHARHNTLVPFLGLRSGVLEHFAKYPGVHPCVGLRVATLIRADSLRSSTFLPIPKESQGRRTSQPKPPCHPRGESPSRQIASRRFTPPYLGLLVSRLTGGGP